MAYKYETHLHTSISSKCGHSKGSETIRTLKELGYDGAFITDHFYNGNTCIDREQPWEDWVHQYCEAYREAKEEGEKIGFSVFFGWEITYSRGQDFLVYGLDEEWLKKHPDVICWDQKEQYEHIHADGGFIVQAHPFRERHYQVDVKLHPYHCDAFEIANCGNEPYMDILARDFAKKLGLPVTAGSDSHRADTEEELLLKNREHFGIQTEQPISCPEDYKKLILSGTGYELLVPEDRFDESNKLNPAFPVLEFDEKNQPYLVETAYYEGLEKARDPRIPKENQ